MDKQKHNVKVVNNALQGLLDGGYITPLDITNDKVSYAVSAWLEAENIARTKLMGMKPVKLYDLSDEDDEDYE